MRVLADVSIAHTPTKPGRGGPKEATVEGGTASGVAAAEKGKVTKRSFPSSWKLEDGLPAAY